MAEEPDLDFEMVLEDPSAPPVSFPDCIHELPMNQCAYCRPGTAKMTSGPWFHAQYDGTCGDCEEPIAVGDMIRANGMGQYVCQTCG